MVSSGIQKTGPSTGSVTPSDFSNRLDQNLLDEDESLAVCLSVDLSVL